MERYYNIAGIDICITGKDEELYTDEKKLRVFRSEKTDDAYRVDFQIVKQLSEPIGICVYDSPSRKVYQNEESCISYIGLVSHGIQGAETRSEQLGKNIKIEVCSEMIRGRISSKLVLNALSLERLVVKEGGVILHSSYIVWNGKGILFTAPSGVGKSTQAELWRGLRSATIINGDRSIVRLMNGTYYACGLPFAGSSEYCNNMNVPLSAIVYLGQAQQTKITRLTGAQAFTRVWEGCSIATWSNEDVNSASSIVRDIVQKVPVYKLDCTPDESAVISLEEQLRREM